MSNLFRMLNCFFSGVMAGAAVYGLLVPTPPIVVAVFAATAVISALTCLAAESSPK